MKRTVVGNACAAVAALTGKAASHTAILTGKAAILAAACSVLSWCTYGEQGTATLENNILTLSGLVTNITAEADLGASVTQVVMTAEGGVAFGASVTAAKTYKLAGTGIVSVA